MKVVYQSALLAAIATGCGAPKPPTVAAAPGSAPLVARAAPARFRTITTPPRRRADDLLLPVPDGGLLVDDAGARWLFPRDGGKPVAADLLEGERIAASFYDEARGLLQITHDGRVLSARGVGAYEQLAQLPAGAVASSLRHFHGGLVVRTATGFRFSADGQTFAPVPSLAGREPYEIVLDARGRGAGIFLPEMVARTLDGGRTWTPVALGPANAALLEVFQDQIVALPSSPADAPGRSLDLDTGKTVAVKVAATARRMRRDFGAFRLEQAIPALQFISAIGGATPEGPPMPSPRADGALRLPVPASTIAVDGDRVVAASTHASQQRDGDPRFVIGTLGEGLDRVDDAFFGHCDPASLALCGDDLAVQCDGRLHRVRNGRLVGKSAENRFRNKGTEDIGALGFDREGRLLAAVTITTADYLRSTVLRRYVSDDGEQFEDTVLKAPDAYGARFVGGCHTPGLWLVTKQRAFLLEGGQPTEPVLLERGDVPLAVNAQRSLLVARKDELHVLPDGVPAALPGILPSALSLAQDGVHGLFSARSGQILQTDDGGRSWSPILGPSLRGQTQITCGKTRCLVGSGIVREGFTHGPETVAPWPEPPSNKEPALADPALPQRLSSCRGDKALFAGGLPRHGMFPRLGQQLYAGRAEDLRGRPGAVKGAYGDIDGNAVTEKIGQALPTTPDSRSGDLDVGAPALQLSRTTAPVSHRTLYRWEPRGRLHEHVEDDGLSVFGLAAPLFGEDFVAAQRSGRAGLLVWGRTKPKLFPAPPGFAPDNGVIVATSLGGHLLASADQDGREIQLFSLLADGTVQRRSFLAAREQLPEHGIGIGAGAAPSAGAMVALVERLADGRTEIRLRPVENDLSLGAPLSVPQTSAAPGHLAALSTCARGAKGLLMRTVIAGERTFQVDGFDQRGNVQRLLRVTPEGACVERTLLTGGVQTLNAWVIMAGNGGIAAAFQPRASGLRCEPLQTTPVSRSSPEPRP